MENILINMLEKFNCVNMASLASVLLLCGLLEEIGHEARKEKPQKLLLSKIIGVHKIEAMASQT